MLNHADKMRDRAEELTTRQAELRLLIAEAHPKYQAVVDATMKAKGEFEAALSKQFDGRRINLMGEINTI